MNTNGDNTSKKSRSKGPIPHCSNRKPHQMDAPYCTPTSFRNGYEPLGIGYLLHDYTASFFAKPFTIATDGLTTFF